MRSSFVSVVVAVPVAVAASGLAMPARVAALAPTFG